MRKPGHRPKCIAAAAADTSTHRLLVLLAVSFLVVLGLAEAELYHHPMSSHRGVISGDSASGHVRSP